MQEYIALNSNAIGFFLSKLSKNRFLPYNLKGETLQFFNQLWYISKNKFSNKEEVKSIGNPAGIGNGTGFGLRERDWDGIGLGNYRLRLL